MITEVTKYGKGYETPQGLEENKYYDLMYEFVDLAKVKGLTVRQAQKLFIDCADMVLDIKINDNKINLNAYESITKSLESIAYSLDYLVFNDKRPCSKTHPIPD